MFKIRSLKAIFRSGKPNTQKYNEKRLPEKPDLKHQFQTRWISSGNDFSEKWPLWAAGIKEIKLLIDNKLNH